MRACSASRPLASVALANDRVVYRVQDTGIGIAADAQHVVAVDGDELQALVAGQQQLGLVGDREVDAAGGDLLDRR